MVKPVIKNSLIIFLILVFCIPFTFIVNILLNPFWLWLENTFGIEASGHSGPADWTFEVLYFFLITFFILVYWFIFKNRLKKQR